MYTKLFWSGGAVILLSNSSIYIITVSNNFSNYMRCEIIYFTLPNGEIVIKADLS